MRWNINRGWGAEQMCPVSGTLSTPHAISSILHTPSHNRRPDARRVLVDFILTPLRGLLTSAASFMLFSEVHIVDISAWSECLMKQCPSVRIFGPMGVSGTPAGQSPPSWGTTHPTNMSHRPGLPTTSIHGKRREPENNLFEARIFSHSIKIPPITRWQNYINPLTSDSYDRHTAFLLRSAQRLPQSSTRLSSAAKQHPSIICRKAAPVYHLPQSSTRLSSAAKQHPSITVKHKPYIARKQQFLTQGNVQYSTAMCT